MRNYPHRGISDWGRVPLSKELLWLVVQGPGHDGAAMVDLVLQPIEMANDIHANRAIRPVVDIGCELLSDVPARYLGASAFHGAIIQPEERLWVTDISSASFLISWMNDRGFRS